jgi:predicted transcriptional regulator
MYEECGCSAHHEEEAEFCGCGCHGESHGHHKRRFLTKEEKIERLQKYAEELQKEVAAVQEHIKELRG